MNKELKNKRSGSKKEPLLPFEKMNYILFAVSIGVIVIGFLALAHKPYLSTLSLSVAPVLLVLGYVVLIPLSILYRKREPKASTEE